MSTYFDGPALQVPSASLRQLLEYILLHDNKIVAFDASTGHSLTTNELNSKSRQVANYLQSRNAAKVGVCFAPSLKLLSTLCGLVRQVVTYVAIDPSLPQERVSYIIADSEVDIVIYDEDMATTVNTSKWIKFGDILATPDVPEAINLQNVTKEDLFAILYTSGSSGQPKGVKIPHRALINRLYWQWNEHPFNKSTDVVCAKTQIGFVDSICEVWAPLLQGVKIVFLPKSLLMSPTLLIGALNEHHITRLTLVPSLIRVILEAMKADKQLKCPTLKYLVSSGETLTADLCEQFFELFSNCVLGNYYGSTEVMADVTADDFTSMEDVRSKSYDGRVSIGLPIANVSLVVHDMDERDIGELIFCGFGVTSGYFGGAAADDKFVSAADLGHGARLGETICFRSGDRGKLINNSFVVYYGRNDSQVKISGNRVDLSEVERALEVLEFERPPLVLFNGEKILAFVTGRERAIERGILIGKLPSYAIPEFVFVDEFPLMAVSGKVDRQELLNIYKTRQNFSFEDVDWETFTSLDEEDKEKFKALIKVLDEQKFATSRPLDKLLKQNFFQIGGTSLNAILSISKLKQSGHEISIENFLKADTLSDIIANMNKFDGSTASADSTAIEAYDLKKYMVVPVHDGMKNEVMRLIAENFCDEDLTSYATHSNRALRKLCGHEMVVIMEHLWEYVKAEEYISFAIYDQSNQLIGASLNFAEDNQPATFVDTSVIGAIVNFLGECEHPLVEKLKSEGRSRIFHGFVMAVDKKVVKSSAERVEGMIFMEKVLMDIAKKRGFQAIVTTNSSPLTQDAAEHVLGYEVYKVVDNLAKWVDKSKDGLRPFKLAPPVACVKVCYKLIN